MTVAEKILQHLRSLPEAMQAEVLDFVERLEAKARKGDGTEEDSNWSVLSLSQAMRGMESEPSLYTTDDLREVFS
jgi:hypothetical protein